MEQILTIEGLSKSFQNKKVIDHLDMNVPKGSIYGFVGKNGAGKTTTMKLILGLLKKDSGNIQVLDKAVHFGNTETNQHIGYLPDVPSFYDYMNAKEYLIFIANLLNQDQATTKQSINILLEKVGLNNVTQKIGGFSRGMKQRLGIAQALIGKPDLLICDEPTSALDPNGRRDILSILKSIKQETTVIFSTHILSDVQDICDYIGILDQGKLVLEGKIEDLEQQNQMKLIIRFDSLQDTNECYQLLKDTFTSIVNNKEITYQISNQQQDSMFILNTLCSHQLVPQTFAIKKKTMEDLFLEVTL